MVQLENIFANDGVGLKEELVNILISAGNIVRLEGVISPESETPSRIYDQDEDEFVMIARGYAELEFEDERGAWNKVKMIDGDYTYIPAHLKHRVIKTKQGTVWLALFYTK
ncbi:cupin domain-containing protein [Candidatus Pacearchaeota archaeon]|nr:cupin domain-containing protein [Candidatus Pacearchaeota archaeon]